MRKDIVKYKAYTLFNYKTLPQIKNLSEEELFNIDVVGKVLPFKSNNYVVDELIDWNNYKNDPLFILTFPQKSMLKTNHFNKIADLIRNCADNEKINDEVNKIRLELNPHPGGQMEQNVPVFKGKRLSGIQHKYKETMLIFPRQGQTCHAYCTFCFRWPQFLNEKKFKFHTEDVNIIIEYLKANPQITNILFTGGDPMVMSASVLSRYIEPILDLNLKNLVSIRIGTKALSYWPYKFFGDKDSDELINLFLKIKKTRKHLAIMAHFNHTNELRTKAVRRAIHTIRETGAQIRTQSPLLKHINDDAKTWSDMLREQVKRGIIPYYMFLPRDTGAQHYFSVPLVKAWEIYKDACKDVSGLSKTLRGPVMSCTPGKVQVLGVANVHNEKVISLKMLQGRNSEWTNHPFFAEFNPKAIWFDDLKPAFGEKKFFFQDL
ncbi:MAG: lysine 2,3-aminomutase [Ignavibacteria bacterium RIFOXYC2_FULL_35_21]|nr:MAG: lysine 2,3-aminomutase [Ignavibacteria bacterium RIFOXYA2_FULL_35_10]OGV23642.1 MAG: lysine 2,3-aminomutase [Ignavibacteria bacterium RIFOXYC2_FULL_35_21]